MRPRCERCDEIMRAEAGRVLDSDDVLLWWRCTDNPRHIGTEIVLPESLAAVALATIRSGDRAWIEPRTTEAPGGTSRETVSAPSRSSSEERLARAPG